MQDFNRLPLLRPVDLAKRFANQIRPKEQLKEFPAPYIRQGEVMGVAAGGASCTITLGDSAVAISGVKFLDSYFPVVGDSVEVVVFGTDLLVLGKVGVGAALTRPYQSNFLRVATVGGQAIDTTVTDVANMTWNFTTVIANARLRATLDARFIKTSGGVPPTQLVVAYLVVNGTLVNSAHMTMTNPLYDDVRSCSWIGSVGAAGAHSVKAQVVRTGTTETIVISEQVGTGLTAEVWG